MSKKENGTGTDSGRSREHNGNVVRGRGTVKGREG